MKVKNNVFNILVKFVLIFCAIFVPFREIIALYTSNYIKFIPDVIIWITLGLTIAKNKFRINLKKYDLFFIGFIFIGFISCVLNSVSIIGFALQVRSIGTMYALFYILRNTQLERKDYSNVINLLVYVNSAIIIIAILEIISNKMLFLPTEWSNSIIFDSNYVRAYSLMNNPNTFAMFTFMILILYYTTNENKISKKHFLFYLLAFIGIFLSASRSTLIAIIIFFIYLIIKSIYKKYFYNLIVMLSIFVISFISVIGIEYLKQDTEIQSFVQATVNKINKDDLYKDDLYNKEDLGNSNLGTTDKTPSNSASTQTGKTEKPQNSIAILDRIDETTSGVTAENSKVDGRIYVIQQGLKIFKKYPILGTGFATFGSAGSRMVYPKLYEKYELPRGLYSDNEYIKIIVETGIIGTIIFAGFCISLLIESVKQKNNYNLLIFFEFLFMGLFYNVFEMQILCFLLYFSLVYYEKIRDIKKTDDKKISILALHLGTGGVEQVVVNTANMLCNDYEVEIISLYNHHKKIPFELDKKVKITYLMNTISNKEKVKQAIKDKNLLNIFKEGTLAFYILANKNRLMIKAIDSCDSKVIISTRYNFSKLLNDFGNQQQYKIHQEHTYSVSEEYINKLNKLNKINCIMPASQTIYEKYNNKVKARLIYIPFVLNYYPSSSEVSKLNTKNLIAVGRLEKEKGFDDLLTIVSKLKDKDVFLNLFGDGSLMNSLKQQARDLGIEKKVKFWGFKNQEFIKKYMLDSSLYVMTSHEESFGLVLIEAMSYGVPCIAYDSAEGAKYTINKENGYFIKNRNEKEMIKTIESYLKMKVKDKEKMSKAALKTIETYKYDKVKKEWLEFVKDALEEL